MKKRLVAAALTAVMSMAMGMTAFAGQWQTSANGWWWQEDNGSYPTSQWKWLDGNQDGIAECYYFNADGYMLANTTTPDGYQVNSDGAWVVDGGVQLKFWDQTQEQEEEEDEEEETQSYNRWDMVGEYYEEDGDTYISLNIGVGESLVGFYYNSDGDLTIYNFDKMSDTKYRDSSRSKTLTILDYGAISFNDKVYYN